MTPGVLLIIIAVVWAVVLVGLLRLLAVMERVERMAPDQGARVPTRWPAVGGARRG
ncbi:MAG: hypothetical protein QN187_01300 [Armatimonadota bacterium]|nr:hypothetical protein [Armatimonadota bacterium]MDR7518061.1 hypothetical protein [Armatimonadota bacterium]